MTTILIGLAFVVIGTLGYIALRNAKDFSDANEIIPGVKTNAPKAWAGAHSPEARMHRRLRDAMTALRANRSLDGADLATVREAIEQEALALDARLVAVAALPGRHKEDQLRTVEQGVSAIEAAAADVVSLRGPAVEDVEIGLAGVRTRIALVREARAELAGLSDGGSASLERMRAEFDAATGSPGTSVGDGAPATGAAGTDSPATTTGQPTTDQPATGDPATGDTGTPSGTPDAVTPARGISLPGSASRMARRQRPEDLAAAQQEMSEAERLRAEFDATVRGSQPAADPDGVETGSGAEGDAEAASDAHGEEDGTGIDGTGTATDDTDADGPTPTTDRGTRSAGHDAADVRRITTVASMSGRHLRRGHGLDPRWLLAGVAAVLVGLLIGAVGTVVLDEDDPAVRTTSDDTNPSPDDAAEADGPGRAALVAEPGPIVLAFAGDVNAEFGRADVLAEDPGAFVGPFADVLEDADLSVVNVEAAIADDGTPAAKDFTFRVSTGILAALRAGGVDVVSAANDHAIDLGPEGLAETIAAKRAATDPARSAAVIGIGEDDDEAFAPVLRDVGGHTVAVIAATQVLDATAIQDWTAGGDQAGVASAKRVDRLVAEVEAVRPVADTVVVYLHWGTETQECPSGNQQELAEALAGAGADVVVGTHAHRVQGGGMLGDTFVHYGLGNFLFGAASPASARTGVLLVEVDGRDVLGYEWVPGVVRDAVAVPLEGADADAEVATWEAQRACTALGD